MTTPPQAVNQTGFRPWSPDQTTVTTLMLVRHGVTEHTEQKLFSSGLSGANPGLTEAGREQVRATGRWLTPIATSVAGLVSSPVRRTDESAQILSDYLGSPVTHEPGIAEMDFGEWDGRSFADVWESQADELVDWLGSPEGRAGGGESLNDVRRRVLAGRDLIIDRHRGTTVVVVSHVTPIKVLVADALGAPWESLRRMELSPAGVSVINYFDQGPDGQPMASLRVFNARPTEAMFTEHHRH
ncbi:MAG TPA: histidine phosphatase family protein [Marmoricola sp.]|nr:histidine phosphatase family protein [Marmoricola sp.]